MNKLLELINSKKKKSLGLNDTFPYGKFKGHTVATVLHDEPSYIVWWHEETDEYEIDADIVEEAEDLQTFKEKDWY